MSKPNLSSCLISCPNHSLSLNILLARTSYISWGLYNNFITPYSVIFLLQGGSGIHLLGSSCSTRSSSISSTCTLDQTNLPKELLVLCPSLAQESTITPITFHIFTFCCLMASGLCTYPTDCPDSPASPPFSGSNWFPLSAVSFMVVGYIPTPF